MEAPDSDQKLCPSCGSRNLWRSTRRGLAERYFLRILQIRPYRCAACDNRFYGREMPPRPVGPRTVDL
jgi:DNA-directed RNA polymerase subunit RPC12/RpoP